jgi:hypothetical protein
MGHRSMSMPNLGPRGAAGVAGGGTVADRAHSDEITSEAPLATPAPVSRPKSGRQVNFDVPPSPASPGDTTREIKDIDARLQALQSFLKQAKQGAAVLRGSASAPALPAEAATTSVSHQAPPNSAEASAPQSAPVEGSAPKAVPIPLRSVVKARKAARAVKGDGEEDESESDS